MEKAWKKLWTIQCPNKMKIVLWRITHNCLPTGFLLRQYVTEIWKQLKKDYGISLKLFFFIHISQWMLDWITEAPADHSMILAVAMWHIWENRNCSRNGEALAHPLRVVGKIKAYINFITLYNGSSTGCNRRETSISIQKWSLPPQGLLLINVDAAIFSHSRRAGCGVVACDHQEVLLAANRCAFDHIQNPEVAEALAVRQALIFAKRAKVQVASDCLTLINKVRDVGIDRSLIGAIVQDIKSSAAKF